jgi:GNAT superfamily N-acetyltransferase
MQDAAAVADQEKNVSPSSVHKVDWADTYRTKVQLKNGKAAIIRSIQASDKPILQIGMHHLSNQARFFRFLTVKKELSAAELKYFTELDFLHHVGLIACVVEENGEIPAAVGRYILIDADQGPPTAEVAFAVDEKYQGLGIASQLLTHLAKIARAEGIQKFIALVHPQNQNMMRVFEHCGLPMHRGSGSLGTVEVKLDLA